MFASLSEKKTKKSLVISTIEKIDDYTDTVQLLKEMDNSIQPDAGEKRDSINATLFLNGAKEIIAEINALPKHKEVVAKHKDALDKVQPMLEQLNKLETRLSSAKLALEKSKTDEKQNKDSLKQVSESIGLVTQDLKEESAKVGKLTSLEQAAIAKHDRLKTDTSQTELKNVQTDLSRYKQTVEAVSAELKKLNDKKTGLENALPENVAKEFTNVEQTISRLKTELQPHLTAYKAKDAMVLEDSIRVELQTATQKVTQMELAKSHLPRMIAYFVSGYLVESLPGTFEPFASKSFKNESSKEAIVKCCYKYINSTKFDFATFFNELKQATKAVMGKNVGYLYISGDLAKAVYYAEKEINALDLPKVMRSIDEVVKPTALSGSVNGNSIPEVDMGVTFGQN